MGWKETFSSLMDGASSILPGGETEPDPQRQHRELTDSMDSTQDDLSYLEGVSGTQLAQEIAAMTYIERASLAENDAFIKNHWERTKDAIRDNETLSNEFGVTEQNFVGGQGTTCKHHTNAPIDTVPVEPKMSRTVGQSRRHHEGMTERLGAAGSQVGANHGEQTAARAETTTTQQGMSMEYCKADPDNCKTSKWGFYEAANQRFKNLNKGMEKARLEKFQESELERESNAQESNQSNLVEEMVSDPDEKSSDQDHEQDTDRGMSQ